MLNQEIYPNGETQQRLSEWVAIPRHSSPGTILKILEANYAVPHEVVNQLKDSITSAAGYAFDAVVRSRKGPQLYYALRLLQDEGWLS